MGNQWMNCNKANPIGKYQADHNLVCFIVYSLSVHVYLLVDKQMALLHIWGKFPNEWSWSPFKIPYGVHSIDSTVHNIERRSINKLDNLLCRLSLVRSTVGEYGGFYHPAHLSGVCLCWGGKCREANKRSQGAKRATPRIIEKHIKCCDNNTAQTLNILQRCFLLSVAIHIKCSFADSLLVL